MYVLETWVASKGACAVAWEKDGALMVGAGMVSPTACVHVCVCGGGVVSVDIFWGSEQSEFHSGTYSSHRPRKHKKRSQ